MKAYELEQAIKKQGLRPLYFISGEEDYLRDQAAATIKAAVVEQAGGLADFNFDLLYGDESEASEILAKAGEAPVFASRRLVLLKAAEKLPVREGEALLPYLKAPCESTTLVVVASKLDGRTRLAQVLKEQAAVVDCSPLPEQQLPGWIRAEAGRLGVRLNEEAVLLLKDLAAGNSLYLLRRELEKLAAYVPNGQTAGPAEVESLRGGEAGASVFDLASAIGGQDRHRVLRILSRNLEMGEMPLRILGSLVWQYRQIWKAKDLLRRGGGEGEVARILRLPPFKVKEFLGRFSEAHLQSAFRMFMETDSKLKGGSANAPARTLEALLLALCSSERGSGPRTEGRGSATVNRPQPAKRERKTIPTVRTIRSVRPSER
ncbi:MAG: DNA polymerase III subunit delta [Nitrospiraceae bacterium]